MQSPSTSVIIHLTFPSGIEDVVQHQILREMRRLGIPEACVLFHSVYTPKREFTPKPPRKPLAEKSEEELLKKVKPDPNATKYSNAWDAMCHLRGALFFSFESLPMEKQLELLGNLIQYHRCVEKVCLHLFSTPCTNSVEEVDESFLQHIDSIYTRVTSDLGRLQRALYRRPQMPVVPLDKREDKVSFRVNAVRRDKSIPCPFKSTDIAAHLGGLIAEHDRFTAWDVNMLYYNTEFFAVHDEHFLHVGVSLSPNPLPRCGKELGLSTQWALEFERDYIGHLLHTGGIDKTTSSHLKALIPRHSSHRNEVRVNKGENAMNPALAAALVEYADMTIASSILDPFAGSGTVLVEAILASDFSKPLMLLGSDIAATDTVKVRNNTQLTNILKCALFQGLALTNGTEEENLQVSPVLERIEEWKAWVQTRIQRVDIASLTAENITDVLAAALGSESSTMEQEIEAQVYHLSQHLSLRGCLTLAMQADGVRLPWRSGSVDRIVSDLPFGRRCGTHKTNLILYPLIVKECYRVLRSSDDHHSLSSPTPTTLSEEGVWWGSPYRVGRAVLLTIEGELMMQSLSMVKEECPFRLVRKPFIVDMGGLFPYVFVLDKC